MVNEALTTVITLILLLVSILLVRVLYMLIKTRIRRHRLTLNPWKDKLTKIDPSKIEIMTVLGSGGHTKEMLTLLSALPEKFSPRHYIVADTDKLSLTKVQGLHEPSNNVSFLIHIIPRSREVQQSYASSVMTTLLSIWKALPIVFGAKPKFLICNGPGTCIPIVLWVFMFNCLLLRTTQIVYVESICRVKTLSLTGKILYYIADHFLVQWPELQARYPLSSNLGRLM